MNIKTMPLTKEDIWGHYDENHNKINNGMIVSRSNEKCEIFGDIVPYKSVTVICDIDQEDEVLYWLDYVQGNNNVTDKKILKDNKIAFRSDYQCW